MFLILSLVFLPQVGLSDLTTPEEVNAIILSEEGAVVAFVSRAYEVRVNRTQRKEMTERCCPGCDVCRDDCCGAPSMTPS